MTENEIEGIHRTILYGPVPIDYGTSTGKLQVSLTSSMYMCYYIFVFVNGTFSTWYLNKPLYLECVIAMDGRRGRPYKRAKIQCSRKGSDAG
jgi:hypothetical protein